MARATKTNTAFKDQQSDEWDEVKGSSDYAPTHDFDEDDTLIGTYLGRQTVQTKKGESIKHTFETDDGEVDAWGTAILNSRLEEVEPGSRVKIIYRGKITTSSGNQARDFGVFVARSAFNKAGK